MESLSRMMREDDPHSGASHSPPSRHSSNAIAPQQGTRALRMHLTAVILLTLPEWDSLDDSAFILTDYNK